MWYEGRWWISRALVKPLTGRRQDWIWNTMVIEYQHQTHKTEVFGTVSTKGFLYWEAASTVSVNACSIRPRSLQSTSSTALHTKLLVRVIGFGKSRHYHLLWDGIHDLEKGKKYCSSILLGYQSPTPQAEALLVIREETKSTRDWTRGTPQHLHHMVLQRFRSAGYTVLQTNSQGWWDTAGWRLSAQWS